MFPDNGRLPCGWRYVKTIGIAVTLVALAFPSLPVSAQEKRARVGLVLGGGGARGFAHLGVLKVLEEMRIPISCIAGTSMGSLVGGVYAAGVPLDEMIDRLARIDWNDLFTDDPPRSEKPFRAKRDDYENLFHFELGQRGSALLMPSGTTAGYKFEFLLREMVARTGNFANQEFDRLPIPYRAMATDIEYGKSVEFDRGDLVKVMRASMSVPGAIAPVEIDGSLYVDGGLLQNVPVSAARNACGDAIIAVNVGSGLLPREKLASALRISLQMVNVLTEQNVRDSIAELGPSDVLIEPALDDYGPADFAGAMSLIPVGEEAARRNAEALRRFSVSDSEYRAWRASVLARLPRVPPVAEVRVDTALGRVNPEILAEELAYVPGIDLRRRPEANFSIENLNSRLAQVYGRGDFERMDYAMNDIGGKRAVEVQGVEKSWGPDYLKFGLGLASDTYQTRFNINLSHRMTWLNAYGAEWRNDVELGYRKRFVSEFHQPLVTAGGIFVAPRLELHDEPVVFYFDGRRIGEYRVRYARTHLDLGTQNKYGELRLGPYIGRVKADEDFGFVSAGDRNVRRTGYAASASYDQIDNPQFPRDGLLASLKTFGAVGSWGSDVNYNKTEHWLIGARRVDQHAVQLAAYAGRIRSNEGTIPAYDPLLLGGFLRGSGYRLDEFFGRSADLARAVYTYQFAALPPQLGRGIYFGGSLEAFRFAQGLSESEDKKVRASSSVFVGADTVLGPLYLAWGQGLTGDRPGALYILLGRPW